MSKSIISSPLSAGFTIIELLVVMFIILLLTGGGIAAFIRFSQRQTMLNAAKDIRSYLRTAQTKARVGETPSGCVKLDGYVVKSQDVGSSTQVEVIADCSNQQFTSATHPLPDGVSLTADFEVTFLGLHGGVANAGTIELINELGTLYQLEVTQGGEITQGDFVE